MSVRESHPLRRLRPSGCPALDDSAGQAPLTPPSPQKSPLRAKWRGEGGTLRPAQRAYAAPLPHLRGQRQCQSASRCKLRRLALRARLGAAPWRTGGSLCRCSLQSAGQHSSPDGRLADSAASATPPPSQRQPLRFRRPGPRLHPERTQRPSRYAKADPQRPLGKRLAFHSAVARKLATPCVAP